MRIARVIGKLILNRRMSDLVPGRLLIVRPLDREQLAGAPTGDETVIVFDELSARDGDLIGLTEGREATAPFWPKKVPYDSYNAAILDEVDFRPVLRPGGAREQP